MIAWYPWIIFVHLFVALLYMLLHGVEAAAMWQLRSEPDPQRSITFFSMRPSLILLRVVFGLLVLTGLVAGLVLPWWKQGWMWTSLGILILLGVIMNRLGKGYFDLIARTAADALHERTRGGASTTAAQAFEAARRSWQPIAATAAGLVGLALILWLMMFKPF